MTEITNSNELQAAIQQLELDVRRNEYAIKQKISAIQESLQPANILAAAFNKITGFFSNRYDPQRSFSENTIKGGLMLWFHKLLSKAEQKVEQNVADGIDKVIDYVKDLIKRKN